MQFINLILIRVFTVSKEEPKTGAAKSRNLQIKREVKVQIELKILRIENIINQNWTIKINQIEIHHMIILLSIRNI